MEQTLPGRAMRFPRAETDPAEVKLAAFAHHVITSAVLLNGRSTPRTLLQQTSFSYDLPACENRQIQCMKDNCQNRLKEKLMSEKNGKNFYAQLKK